MTRRKIAFGVTAGMTLLLILLRLGVIPFWNDLKIGPLDAAHLMPILIVIATIAITILCFSKNESAPLEPQAEWKSTCGWFSTFAGAVLTLVTLYNVICLVVFGEIPPPNHILLNQVDTIAMILMLLFGLAGGVFLVLLGFGWMSNTKLTHPLFPWLSIAPTLWMWFRLARYEISYASTVDISENVFDFSIMIFSSLFLLQLARTVMHIGKTPKNGLLIFALCTAMIALSGIPAEFMSIPSGASLSLLLIVVIDTVIGMFAGVYATMIVFGKETVTAEESDDTAKILEQEEEATVFETQSAADILDGLEEEAKEELAAEETGEDDDTVYAWTTPVRDPAPVEPPFDIDSTLPEKEAIPAKAPPTTLDQTIDDLLKELDID